ncbi:MAG TPA: gliding motility protein GldN [Prolixibacteraceae bacterium]|nr:gliding motility protein GldN [Prolixibacteraceae bacterium]HPR59501.1 gliding motility protein GldN [Prolixibacteraceae bacterium]
MKAIIRIALFILIPLYGISQEGVRFTDKFGPFHDTYQQENDFSNREYAQYPFVREADVVWQKITWQIIDLREKMNLPLYYPIDEMHQRKSLIKVILDGIEQNQFNAFRKPLRDNAFEFDPNNIFLSMQELKDVGMREEIVPIEIRPGVTRDSLVSIRWRPEEIKQILIKEVWYFNRRDSRLHVETIGICPIREYFVDGLMRRQRLFWIYYPDARPYMATVPVYSMNNDRPLYTYDDLFVNRYFNSYFIQEANVYNDRTITDYVTGREAQLESERIKREIFDYEQNLWEN